MLKAVSSKLLVKNTNRLLFFASKYRMRRSLSGYLFSGLLAVEHHLLVALQSGRFVDGLRVKSSTTEIPFRANDEEGPGLVHEEEAGKVEIAAIHDVDCAGFCRQIVEDVGIVNLSIGNDNKGWDVAAKIQQGV